MICKNCGHKVGRFVSKELLHFTTNGKGCAETYSVKCHECFCKKPEAKEVAKKLTKKKNGGGE